MPNQPTPEQMAQNMLKGVKNAYVFVAVRHVHPWYSWALMAAAIGFAVGVGYVANRNVQFDASQAAAPNRAIESMNSPMAVMQLLKAYNTENRIETLAIQRGVLNIVDGPENDSVILSEKQPYSYSADQKNEPLLTAMTAFSNIGATYELLINDSTVGRRGFLVFTDGMKLGKSDFANYSAGREAPATTATKKPNLCSCDVSGKITLMETQTKDGKTTSENKTFDINYNEKVGSCTNDAACVSSCLFGAENKKVNALNKNYEYLEDDSDRPIILYSWFEGSSENLKNASKCDNSVANIMALP